jgi:hypothetical protein
MTSSGLGLLEQEICLWILKSLALAGQEELCSMHTQWQWLDHEGWLTADPRNNADHFIAVFKLKLLSKVTLWSLNNLV